MFRSHRRLLSLLAALLLLYPLTSSCGGSSARRILLETEGISDPAGAAGESAIPASGAGGEPFGSTGGSGGTSGAEVGGAAGQPDASGGSGGEVTSGGVGGDAGSGLVPGSAGDAPSGSGGELPALAGAPGFGGAGGGEEPCVGTRTLVDEDFSSLDPASWSLAGSATHDGFSVGLTPMDTGQKGQLWSSVPIVGGEFQLSAQLRVLDDTTTADGFAFILAETAAPPEFLSQTIQQTLVNTGIPGYAVLIDTYLNPDDPATPYLAVVDLPSGNRIRTVGMSSAIPNLANGAWRTLEIHLDAAGLSVNVGGLVSLIDVPVSPADSYYWGFLATCGAFPTVYAVDDVFLEQSCP